MIRIVLVDDHPAVTDGLRGALESETDMAVIATAATVADATAVLEREVADVAIIDIRLPDGSGFDLLVRSKSLTRPPAFLILSSFDTPQYTDAAIELGASGLLLKTAPTADIVAAVRRVAAGGLAYEATVVAVGTRERWTRLTSRERDIVRGVLDGRSNDEIAVAHGISRKTVEAHLSKLFDRFRVTNRTDLALRAERERWLDLPSVERRH